MAEATDSPVAAADATDPWTSTSATPAGEVTQSAPAEPETVADAASLETPEAPVEAVTQPVRDQKGQFTKASRKTNPHEAVKQATGEAARERERAAAAERRAADLERQLAERASARTETREPEAPKKPEPTRPKPVWDETKYASYEDFTDDRADWIFEQKLASGELDTRVEQRFQQHLATQQEGQRRTTIRELGQKTYADWNAVMDAAKDVSFPKAVLSLPDDEIPHVFYALARDQDLAARLVALDNPVALGLELAKLLPSSGVAMKPSSTPTTRVSSALPPVSRVGGTASAVPVDPDELEFGPDYIRKGNEADKKRREANRW